MGLIAVIYKIYSKNKMVGAAGFEPATPWSQTRCATKLRHAPIIYMFMKFKWSGKPDSNRRHPAWKAGALAN